MERKTYSIEHECGEDWKVVDEKGVPQATGLSHEEAEETLKRLNKKSFKGA